MIVARPHVIAVIARSAYSRAGPRIIAAIFPDRFPRRFYFAPGEFRSRLRRRSACPGMIARSRARATRSGAAISEHDCRTISLCGATYEKPRNNGLQREGGRGPARRPVCRRFFTVDIRWSVYGKGESGRKENGRRRNDNRPGPGKTRKFVPAVAIEINRAPIFEVLTITARRSALQAVIG